MNIHLLNTKIAQKGIKKQHLASELGITPNSMSNKLKGLTKFDIDEVSKLVNVLGLSTGEIAAIFFDEQRDSNLESGSRYAQ